MDEPSLLPAQSGGVTRDQGGSSDAPPPYPKTRSATRGQNGLDQFLQFSKRPFGLAYGQSIIRKRDGVASGPEAGRSLPIGFFLGISHPHRNG